MLVLTDVVADDEANLDDESRLAMLNAVETQLRRDVDKQWPLDGEKAERARHTVWELLRRLQRTDVDESQTNADYWQELNWGVEFIIAAMARIPEDLDDHDRVVYTDRFIPDAACRGIASDQHIDLGVLQ